MSGRTSQYANPPKGKTFGELRVLGEVHKERKTQTVTDWAKELDVNRTTVYVRIRRGMSPEEALLTPIDTSKRRKRKVTERK